jgi:hypothetical protein
MVGQSGDIGGIIGVALHYLRYGPKDKEEPPTIDRSRYTLRERVMHWAAGLRTSAAGGRPRLLRATAFLAGYPVGRGAVARFGILADCFHGVDGVDDTAWQADMRITPKTAGDGSFRDREQGRRSSTGGRFNAGQKGFIG